MEYKVGDNIRIINKNPRMHSMYTEEILQIKDIGNNILASNNYYYDIRDIELVSTSFKIGDLLVLKPQYNKPGTLVETWYINNYFKYNLPVKVEKICEDDNTILIKIRNDNVLWYPIHFFMPYDNKYSFTNPKYNVNDVIQIKDLTQYDSIDGFDIDLERTKFSNKTFIITKIKENKECLLGYEYEVKDLCGKSNAYIWTDNMILRKAANAISEPEEKKRKFSIGDKVILKPEIGRESFIDGYYSDKLLYKLHYAPGIIEMINNKLQCCIKIEGISCWYPESSLMLYEEKESSKEQTNIYSFENPKYKVGDVIKVKDLHKFNIIDNLIIGSGRIKETSNCNFRIIEIIKSTICSLGYLYKIEDIFGKKVDYLLSDNMILGKVMKNVLHYDPATLQGLKHISAFNIVPPDEQTEEKFKVTKSNIKSTFKTFN